MGTFDEIKKIGYTFKAESSCGYRTNQPFYSVEIQKPNGEKKVHHFSPSLHRNFIFGEEKIAISERELFDNLFNLTEEENCKWQYGYSLRTFNFFESLKNQIGFVGVEYNNDGDIWSDGSFEKTPYFDSEIHQGIDDWCEETIYFNHFPSKQDVAIANFVISARTYFRIGKWREEFTCWECGCKIHWLDINGDVRTKIDCMEERYCGC